MIQARVKKDSKINPVVACGGVMFFRHEWTIVPAGSEAEAERNPYLLTGNYEPKPEPEPEPKPELKPEPKAEITPEPESESESSLPAEEVGNDIRVTDEARKYAAEMRVKLAWVTGTGHEGKILKSDVEGYLTQKTS